MTTSGGTRTEDNQETTQENQKELNFQIWHLNFFVKYFSTKKLLIID